MKNTPIEYKYLNMDSNKFYDTQGELIESVGKGGLIRYIPALPKYNQVLFASGQKSFTGMEAVLRCRKLCGIMPHGKKLKETRNLAR